MTTPNYGTSDWDDTLDVDRALRSLDEVGEIPTQYLGTDPLGAPVMAPQPTVATMPEQTVASMTGQTVSTVPEPTTAIGGTAEQTVLRRKRPTRRTDVDDGRTLRRNQRTRPQPINAVPSMPYADDAMPTPSSTGRMTAVPRRRALVGMLLFILLLRLAAIGMCALVVVMAVPSLVGRLSLLQVVETVTSLMPSQLAGVLVIPTPFDGAFRGDFGIAAFVLFVVDWLLTRLRARMRMTGV